MTVALRFHQQFTLKPQELAADHPDATFKFQPRNDLPFVATTAALAIYSLDEIVWMLTRVRDLARERNGLDYLQVFETTRSSHLWFIENSESITALLPSDY